MKLVRLATLDFDKKESEFLESNWMLSIGEVKVESHSIGSAPEVKGDKKRILVFASIELNKMPEKSEGGVIFVPDIERKKAEEAIEIAANIISTTERCSRSISSASPCVAFIPDDEEARFWLENSKGIAANKTAVPDTHFSINISEDIINTLSGRTDGVALLAEALSSDHAGNKYREFIRLFERAFQLSATQLDKKLTQFLEGSDLGYERKEIKKWLEFRHGSMHADGKKTNQIVLESDVKRYVPRMEQAAYDVLLNKKDWRSPSKERIKNWIPTMATSDERGGLQITKGEPATLKFQAFDEFQVYPLDLNAVITRLPAKMWSKWTA